MRRIWFRHGRWEGRSQALVEEFHYLRKMLYNNQTLTKSHLWQFKTQMLDYLRNQADNFQPGVQINRPAGTQIVSSATTQQDRRRIWQGRKLNNMWSNISKLRSNRTKIKLAWWAVLISRKYKKWKIWWIKTDGLNRNNNKLIIQPLTRRTCKMWVISTPKITNKDLDRPHHQQTKYLTAKSNNFWTNSKTSKTSN